MSGETTNTTSEEVAAGRGGGGAATAFRGSCRGGAKQKKGGNVHVWRDEAFHAAWQGVCDSLGVRSNMSHALNAMKHLYNDAVFNKTFDKS